MSDQILSAPATHPLHVVLRELKWGRPAMEQQFLEFIAQLTEARGASLKTLQEAMDEAEREADDPANWWKRKGGGA